MNTKHQSSAWQALASVPRELRIHEVLHLQARAAGWLAVCRGPVWITRDGGGDDHVLDAGERLWLGRGEAVVVEPWQAGGSARLHWLQAAPQAQAVGAQARGGLRWPAAALRGTAWALRGLAGRLLLAARSAERIASRAQGSIRAGDSIAASGALQ